MMKYRPADHSNASRRLKEARGILFDLDNTLYPRKKGVFDYINDRINEYVRLSTGREGQEVELLRKDYLERYGTTLGGLLQNDAVDADDYLEFVHEVPVEELLEPDPSLIGFLNSIELPMVIFTNGTCKHAERVLGALDISCFFDGICDLAATNYLGKPHMEAYETAAGLLGHDLDQIIFIDDLPVNVQAGMRAGALSIHVNGGNAGVGDIQVGCVTELTQIFSPMKWYRISSD